MQQMIFIADFIASSWHFIST